MEDATDSLEVEGMTRGRPLTKGSERTKAISASGGQATAITMQRRRGHKYGAVRTEVDGMSFASKAEARRYSELRLMEKAGVIRNLKVQPAFSIRAYGTHASDKPVASYRGDFAYDLSFTVNGELCWRGVVEDVKGMKTPVYRLKKKLIEAQYGIEITEVT